MSRPANPILRGFYPDPSICRVDGTYYLVNSTFEYLPGIPIHASTDLVDWRLVGHAIHEEGQFDFGEVPDSRGIFAPTIRHHDGLFYIACTQMDGGEVSGNFYLTAPAPEGPWSRPVLLPEARGIDPSLFFHEGRAWWTGCREVLEPEFDGETEVWLRELDLERGELVGPETVIWTRTQYRAVWAEGPHLYHRDGWFYLVTAEGGTSFEHSVMVARSREVAGPYLPCPRNPVLTHRHLGHGAEVQNVGHGDLVEDENGQWWMTVLASRPIDGHHILGRETHLARVDWEDDWPVVNPGLGLLDAPSAAPGRWSSTGAPEAADFLSVRGFATFAEPAEAGLRLRSTGAGLQSGAPTAALLRRLTSTESTVTVTLDQLADDAVAGLVLRQSGAANVRLEVAASVGGLVATFADSSVDLPAGPVTLSARITTGGISWSAGGADLGTTPLCSLSTETAGGFVGTTWGPYVSSGSALFTAWSHEDRS
jgi:xylan 1,4-beta-xylosidase